MRAECSRAISGGHPPHQFVPQRNDPSPRGKTWAIWGERLEMPVRDIRLATDHIQFAAAVQFSSLS
jgi:hypothetical protein